VPVIGVAVILAIHGAVVMALAGAFRLAGGDLK
jgi:hypothetical protein